MIGRTRAERKAAAELRAQLSLKHAIERIDYAEDVIKPKLEELQAAAKLQKVEVEVDPTELTA